MALLCILQRRLRSHQRRLRQIDHDAPDVFLGIGRLTRARTGRLKLRRGNCGPSCEPATADTLGKRKPAHQLTGWI